MGRVKTKTVKRAAKGILEKYFGKLTEDFHLNKKIVESVADISTKRLRNKIAGYTTHLMKRIQKGPVKGVSLRVQEEQRERMLDIIPKESRIQADKECGVDASVMKMLKSRNLESIIVDKKVVLISEANN